MGLPPPVWAFAWAGGHALARYLLDHPEAGPNKRVVDFTAGSDILPLAAMKADAAHVLAADIHSFCGPAIGLNPEANGVAVQFTDPYLLEAPPPASNIVLAGNICYENPLAERWMPWVTAAREARTTVLICDPRRTYFPREGLVKLAEYQVPTTRELKDMEVKKTAVWTLP